MVQDYREISDYGVSRLVGSNIRNARDFRTMESVQIGYYGDLPDVTPETVDYPDLGELSDEKVEYALNQKGGIITITRRMIIDDDMRTVTKIISRLPRAARRNAGQTLLEQVSFPTPPTRAMPWPCSMPATATWGSRGLRHHLGACGQDGHEPADRARQRRAASCCGR